MSGITESDVEPAASLVDEMSSRASATHPGDEVVHEVPDGVVRVDMGFDRETVWLTQQQMAELFGRDSSRPQRIPRRRTGLRGNQCKICTGSIRGGRTVSREVDHCNLDVIISAGCRLI